MKNKIEVKRKKGLGNFLKYNWFFIIAGVVLSVLMWLALGYSL